MKTNSTFVQLDLLEAMNMRDEGIQQAAASADAANEEWNNKAYAFLIEWLYKCSYGRMFFIEEVREDAAKAGIPAPPSNRAWGGITRKAARENLIKRAGYGQTTNVKAHCTPASIWKKI